MNAGAGQGAAFHRALRNPRAWAVLLVVVALFTALDLATKSLAFARIADQPVVVDRAEVLATPVAPLQTLVPPHSPVVVVPHVLELKLVLNAGAVFGSGQGRRMFFIVFTMMALGFALGLFAWGTGRRDYVSHTALGLVISGGLGNLYDRVRFACVRDFLHPLPTAQKPFGMAWPNGETALWPYVSNVADAILLIGIGVLVIRLWRTGAPPHKATPEGLATPDDANTEEQSS